MELPFIRLSREALSRFEDAIKQEWLISNGLGGYASSTVLGINTRKYHGLLVAALAPPRDRRVCLAKLDEETSFGGSTYLLGANELQNGIFPQGHMFLKEFSISPFPKYVYAVPNVEVEKTIFMPHEKNAVITTYNISNRSGSDVRFRVFPLINWRHIHSVTDKCRISWEFIQKQEEKEVDMRFNVPQSVLIMKTTKGRYHAAERWVERTHYREEAMRGESFLDDCYQPGYFEISVEANENGNFGLIAVVDKNEVDARKVLAEMPDTTHDIEALQKREMRRKENLLKAFYKENENVSVNDWLNWIILATDAFIVKGTGDMQKCVIAGYHWFEAWGRDTFVSLPGLMLVTGRFEDAKEVLQTFKKLCERGLIPNFIPDQLGQPVYNSVDTTLWFVNAVLQYLKYTNDFEFVREQLWETLRTIIENHSKGTAFNIRLDSDCLLSHGSQLTWMDAVVDGQPITPRAGKAVEVQALWYSALKTVELLANKFKERSEAERYLQMAEMARRSFVEKFWNPQQNCLFDVVGEYGEDGSLRPNQIVSVALDFTMLDKTKNEEIVDTMHRELLTPYGLRTLARNDPKYIGVYAGDRRSRDKAYHNGTVWPWLIGPFTTAFLKTKGYSDYTRAHALKNFLLPLVAEQIFKAGLGNISEIFDGDSPHTPRGCIAQAWSVAEPFRAYIEDVMQAKPRYERGILRNLKTDT